MASQKKLYKKYYNVGSADMIPRSTLYKRISKSKNLQGRTRTATNKSNDYAHSVQSSDFFIQDKDYPETNKLSEKCESVNDSSNTYNFVGGVEMPFVKAFNLGSRNKEPADVQRHTLLKKEICNCAKLNAGEILLIFMNIAKRHSLTWVALLSIFEALNFIFNRKIMPVSKYMLRKLMDVKTDTLTYHCICPKCNVYIGKYSSIKSSIHCKCGSTITPQSLGSFFIDIDIKDQLTKLLSNPVAVDTLKERLSRKKKKFDNLEDIYDGSVYKRFCKTEIFSKNKWNFSYTFNTDGCQAANDSKVTVWPIYLMIHEFADHLRKKFMPVVGLWVSKVEPDMNIFLQPFVKQANRLSSKGFEWFYNGKIIVSKLFPLGCCVDSVARCAMLNMKKFNGHFGCTFCEHPTVNVNNVRKYPMIKEVPKLRSDQSIKDAMVLASATNEVIKGVKGPSSLMNLKHFDLSKGMIVDFMHSCLLGVTELHAEIILTNATEKYYVGSPSALQIIDQKLLSIKPPSCIGKVPRSLNERHNWKASEWLTWLLFYSLPCLNGILPKKYLNHLSLFVKAMTLLSDSISPDMLRISRKLLIKFVYYFGELFGNQYMHYNVHLLLHVADTVKNWGPLWADSTFPFENQNKNLLQMKKSNHQIANQIFIRLISYQNTSLLETETYISQRVKNYCKNIDNPLLKKIFKVKDCIILGVSKKHTLTNTEIESLKVYLNVENITKCTTYNKMIYRNCRYTTCYFKRCKKTNDSIVELNNNKFGIITAIYVIQQNTDYDVFILYKLLDIFNQSLVNDDDTEEAINIKECRLQSNNNYIIHYTELKRPCILTTSNNHYYVSTIVKGSMGRCIN